MDVLHFTSRKRTTYQIKLEYSLLWECALGIAAITNTPIINTLEKPLDYWTTIKGNMSKEFIKELDYVEKHNTWKAVLQLLHMRCITDLQDFTSHIQELTEEQLKFVCLPFIGHSFQDVRKEAASGNGSATSEMTKLTQDKPYIPQSIDCTRSGDCTGPKERLIKITLGAYEAVSKKEIARLHHTLQTVSAMKR